MTYPILNARNVILIFLAMLLSALAGLAVTFTGGSFQVFLFIALLLALVVAFITSKNPLMSGFALWIWLFILGYRAVHITSDFSLHPLIVLLFLLSLLLLVYYKFTSGLPLKLPTVLWLFTVFWLWGFIPGAFRGYSWLKMLSEALNFFSIVPLFLVMQFLSRQPRFWPLATLTFLGSGCVIALFGLLEYFVPSFRALVAGFAQPEVAGILSQSGFVRAAFSFFGANPAVLICALATPMVGIVPLYLRHRVAATLLMLLALSVLGAAVYISGTRAAWLMVVIASILIAYFRFKFIGTGIVAVFWVTVSRFLPASAWNLLLSISTPLSTGQFVDTSLEKRYMRQQTALELAVRHPFGLGWTGSGWVHGDFAQVAANLGLLAGFVFIAWYLFTLYRGYKRYRRSPDDRLLQVIMTSFVLAGFVLATEGVQVLPQYAMPVWFVWGLLEAYLKRPGTMMPAAPGGADG